MAWEPDYITSAVLKSELRIPATDTQDDAQVARWVTSASRAVDSWCKRQFGKVDTPETRRYNAVYDRHLCKWVAEIDDLMDLTGMLVKVGTTTITDYTLEPLNALLKGRPYERILTSLAGPYDILAPWGWTSIPVNVQAATALQGTRFAARRDSPYGVAGSPSEGSELRLLNRVDPDVEVLLGKRLRREWWVA